MRGYSQGFIEINQNAKDGIGPLLGRLCISLKYPVSQVAKELQVSRQTVYDWFSGKTKPSRHLDSTVRAFVEKLKTK